MWFTGTTATLDSRPSPGRTLLRVIAPGLLVALLVACPNVTFQAHEVLLPHDNLHDLIARGTLRVAARVDGDAGGFSASGIEYELARDFAGELGVSLEIVPAANSGEVLSAL